LESDVDIGAQYAPSKHMAMAFLRGVMGGR
jgi:hypothetical protein